MIMMIIIIIVVLVIIIITIILIIVIMMMTRFNRFIKHLRIIQQDLIFEVARAHSKSKEC